MTHHHLNEEDVQLVAMEPEGLSDRSWAECSTCRERVEAYRQLFGSLAGLEPESPAFDLEAVVMANLPAPVLSKPARRQRSGMPVLVGSLVFLAVFISVLYVLWGYLSGMGNWFTGIAIVTIPGIAAWLMIDNIQDHRRKLRSIGLS